jgi:hypothetical protein
MPGQIEYANLEPGYEFPPTSFTLEEIEVEKYLRAVEEPEGLYRETGHIPPMAIAAQAMAALGKGISLAAGSIHVSQELEFIGTANIGDTFTSRSVVSRNQDRGKLHMLTVDINVFSLEGKLVLSGKTGFIMPRFTEEET